MVYELFPPYTEETLADAKKHIDTHARAMVARGAHDEAILAFVFTRSSPIPVHDNKVCSDFAIKKFVNVDILPDDLKAAVLACVEGLKR